MRWVEWIDERTKMLRLPLFEVRERDRERERQWSSGDNGVAETMAGVVESEVEVMSVMAGEIRQL